jgi:hypothetical protein
MQWYWHWHKKDGVPSHNTLAPSRHILCSNSDETSMALAKQCVNDLLDRFQLSPMERELMMSTYQTFTEPNGIVHHVIWACPGAPRAKL